MATLSGIHEALAKTGNRIRNPEASPGTCCASIPSAVVAVVRAVIA
jgi:hypothetical protein